MLSPGPLGPHTGCHLASPCPSPYQARLPCVPNALTLNQRDFSQTILLAKEAKSLLTVTPCELVACGHENNERLDTEASQNHPLVCSGASFLQPASPLLGEMRCFQDRHPSSPWSLYQSAGCDRIQRRTQFQQFTAWSVCGLSEKSSSVKLLRYVLFHGMNSLLLCMILSSEQSRVPQTGALLEVGRVRSVQFLPVPCVSVLFTLYAERRFPSVSQNLLCSPATPVLPISRCFSPVSLSDQCLCI